MDNDKPILAGRCECYNEHNSTSGRCNSRHATERMPGGAAYCERCAAECVKPVLRACIVTARPMTREEALAEARKRWGARCYLLVHWPTAECEIGYTADGDRGTRFACGTGPTWAAAFTDAERRERAK